MRISSSIGFLTVALASFALACGERRGPVGPASNPEPQAAINEPTPQPPANIAGEPRPQAPQNEPTPQAPMPPIGEPVEDHGTKAEKRLTDAEVLGVAATANRGEVQMADMAAKKATTPEVKQYANMMKSHHQRVLDEGKKLEQKAKLAAGESDLTSTLKADAEKAMTDLRDKKGKDFDRAYMDAQIKAHKEVLDAIDNRLMPSAQHDELKSMLTSMRSTVADHLAKAERIQQKMAAGMEGKPAGEGKAKGGQKKQKK